MYAYSLNNPVVYSDSDGMCAHTAYAPWIGDCEDCITYDVPLYKQGSLNLCWAFCQVMQEQSSRRKKSSQNAATVRAVSVAMSQRDKNGTWNKGGFPTNCTTYKFINEPMSFTVTNEFTISDLAQMLETHGPLYGYYQDVENDRAHMVVITGVNLRDDYVYTNNPWGLKGTQSYPEFLDGFAGNGGVDYTLTSIYIPRS